VNVGGKTERPSEAPGESGSRPPATGGSREGAFRFSQIGQLFLFAIAAWTATYSRLLLGPLQETMRHALSISDNRMAILQGSAIAVPMALGAIPVGLLADRISRKAVLLVAVALALIALMLISMASSYNGLLLARCLLGLSIPGMLVPAYAMGGDLVGPTQRGRATMAVMIGEIAGGPAAFALGGALLVYISASPVLTIRAFGLENWAWTVLWMGGALVLVLALLTLVEDPVRREVVVERPPLRSVLRELWKYRGVAVPLQLGRATLYIADGAVFVWGAPLFARKFHMAPDRIGFTMAVALVVAGLVGPLAGGPLVDFFQRRGGSRPTLVCLTALAALSAPIALFALASSAGWAAVMLTVFLTLGFIISAAAMALTLIVIPGELRALNVGVSLIVGVIFAIGIAPIAVSGLSGVLGGESSLPRALAIVCSSACLLNAVVFALGARHFPVGPSHD
jgi:MFS family permease